MKGYLWDYDHSAMPMTMEYIEEALHAQIKNALCSDEVGINLPIKIKDMSYTTFEMNV